MEMQTSAREEGEILVVPTPPRNIRDKQETLRTVQTNSKSVTRSERVVRLYRWRNAIKVSIGEEGLETPE